MNVSNNTDGSSTVTKTTHKHGQTPAYDIQDDATPVYDASVANHSVEKSNTDIGSMWVYDIETTTTMPSTVILAIGVCESKKEVVMYSNDTHTEGVEPHSYIENKFDGEWMVKRMSSVSRLAGYIVDDVVKFNQNRVGAQGHRVITAHNAFYDLGMSGETATIETERKVMDDIGQDGVWQYRSSRANRQYIHVRHQKAGAYGRMYSVSYENGERVRMPVYDTQVGAKSLYLGDTQSLEDVAAALDVTVKHSGEDEEYGVVTKQHIDYCVDDIEVTKKMAWKINELSTETFGISAADLYSPASVGKRVMAKAGYDRVETPEDVAEKVMPTYFGGQTFSAKRGLTKDVEKVDIMSQYPTTSELGNVWEFVQAEKIELDKIKPTELPTPTMDDMREKDMWGEVARYVVDVELEDTKIATRIERENDMATRVEWSHTSTDDGVSILYNLADVIGADMISGGEIRIKNAWRMVPVGTQSVDSVDIADDTIGAGENIMSKAIQIRKELQKEKGGKDQETLMWKIVANSLYGVLAERITETRVVANQHAVKRHDIDTAGDYLNPAAASMITALGRLQLAWGRAIIESEGSELVYCDTDSFVYQNKGNTSEKLAEWFQATNPYPQDSAPFTMPMLDLEEHDVDIYTHGVKKYAVIDDGEIIDHTDHGLGHFAQLRGDDAEDTLNAFWASVINKSTGLELDVDKTELNTDLTIQQTISTHHVREIYTHHGMKPHYGQFFDFIMSKDDATWIEANKDVAGYPMAIKIDDGGVTMEKSMDCPRKQVGDIVTSWMVSDDMTGHPRVLLTGTSEVSKESYDSVRNVKRDMIKTYKQVCDL